MFDTACAARTISTVSPCGRHARGTLIDIESYSKGGRTRELADMRYNDGNPRIGVNFGDLNEQNKIAGELKLIYKKNWGTRSSKLTPIRGLPSL